MKKDSKLNSNFYTKYKYDNNSENHWVLARSPAEALTKFTIKLFKHSLPKNAQMEVIQKSHKKEDGKEIFVFINYFLDCPDLHKNFLSKIKSTVTITDTADKNVKLFRDKRF